MGFRDDGEAARARAEALDRENRQLREQMAELQRGGVATPETPRRRGSGRGVALVVVGFGAMGAGAAAFGLFNAPLLVVPVAVALGFALILWAVVALTMIVVGPNELVVVSGRRHRAPDGSVVGYRLVRGGRIIRIPLLEQVDSLDLTNMALNITLKGLFTKSGTLVTLDVVANARIAANDRVVRNAVERFLGRSRSEVAAVARETLEGALRGVVVRLSVDELQGDPDRVAQVILEEVADDLGKLGLELDTLSIRKVTPES